jgi:DnaJ-class molecular chaperone
MAENLNTKVELSEALEEINELFALFEGASDKYEICPYCNGYGSSLKEESPKCSKCGGCGLIRKKNKEMS